MINSGGGNYQTQIVTKLPNENIQNYQLQMIDSGGGGGVNYQMLTKLVVWGKLPMCLVVPPHKHKLPNW